MNKKKTKKKKYVFPLLCHVFIHDPSLMSAVEPAADSSHVHCQQRVGDMVRNDDSDNDAWFDEAKANNNSNHTDLEHYYYGMRPLIIITFGTNHASHHNHHPIWL